VEVVYGIMVAQDDLRKRKQMSQNMLIDEEF
jgi:hypothetical protein